MQNMQLTLEMLIHLSMNLFFKTWNLQGDKDGDDELLVLNSLPYI